MTTLFTNISSLVTVSADGASFKRGAEMQEIGIIRNGAMLISDEKIVWIGTAEAAEERVRNGEIAADIVEDCEGKTILPGFADSHTHLVFAGDRSGEFARRLRGTTYQEIAAEGGGILRTMNAVRARNAEEIAEFCLPFAESALRHGTTTIEIKSGYGLSLSAELNQLRAIKILQNHVPMDIAPTFLGAHDIPPEFRSNRTEYIRILCEEMLPKVAEEGLAEFCDVFTDTGYYTVEESEKILRTAENFGIKPKVHADELSCVYSAEMSARLGAVSADHLLCISDEGIRQMSEANVVGTLLPGTAYYLGVQYAPARKMLAGNMILALATDFNPGSCFCENMQIMLSFACTQMRMTMEEAICAATLNGAAALGRSKQTGSLEIGKRADFLIANFADYTNLIYHFGVNHIAEVWIRGKRVVNN